MKKAFGQSTRLLWARERNDATKSHRLIRKWNQSNESKRWNLKRVRERVPKPWALKYRSPTKSNAIKAPASTLPTTSPQAVSPIFHSNVSHISLSLSPVFYNSTESDWERARSLEKTAMEHWRMILPSFLLIFTFLVTDLLRPTHAIWLNLPSTGTKCVSEEIHSNVVVLADYVVISENYTHTPTVSVKVSPQSVNARVFRWFLFFSFSIFYLVFSGWLKM